MTIPSVKTAEFIDITDLPEAHSDSRRTIYEKIIKTKDGVKRTSRSVVTANEVVLGNHYHDFDQEFKGRGEGVLYTAPKDDTTNISEQVLPESGWQFTIPEGLIMALRLKKGAVHTFESTKDYSDGSNTHRVVIAS